MIVVYFTERDGSSYTYLWESQGDWDQMFKVAALCTLGPSDSYWIVPGTYSE